MDSWICTSRQRIRVDLKVCKKARMILKMWKNIWIANTKQNNKFRTAWNDYKKVFFPVGWGKTSQRGGKRLRKGQSLRGGQNVSFPFYRHCIVNTLVSNCHGSTIKLISFKIIMISFWRTFSHTWEEDFQYTNHIEI